MRGFVLLVGTRSPTCAPFIGCELQASHRAQHWPIGDTDELGNKLPARPDWAFVGHAEGQCLLPVGGGLHEPIHGAHLLRRDNSQPIFNQVATTGASSLRTVCTCAMLCSSPSLSTGLASMSAPHTSSYRRSSARGSAWRCGVPWRRVEMVLPGR